jgi:hypothetical protein
MWMVLHRKRTSKTLVDTLTDALRPQSGQSSAQVRFVSLTRACATEEQ